MRTFRIAGDPFHWEMARHLARGNGLGEIGAEPGAEPRLTVGADPHGAAAQLERRQSDGSMIYSRTLDEVPA